MTKRSVNISSLAELQTEERRVRQRIRTQEAELFLRVKKLPEEIVTAAIVKLISAVIKGNMLKSLINFAKNAGKRAFFSSFLKDIL